MKPEQRQDGYGKKNTFHEDLLIADSTGNPDTGCSSRRGEALDCALQTDRVGPVGIRGKGAGGA
jgi:hypothetical protein